MIPRGGTSALGNLGFVAAGLELAEQVERGELPAPDVVYMAMGTMGSVAGLAIGLEAGGLETRVAAVRASNPGTSSRAKLDATLAETIALLRLGVPAFRAVDDAGRRIRIVEDQLGAGYGRPTPAGERALALAEEDAGLRLERTYTAKALAAIVADAPSLRDRTVLFWNTHSSRPLPPPPDPRRLPAAPPASLFGARIPDRRPADRAPTFRSPVLLRDLPDLTGSATCST